MNEVSFFVLVGIAGLALLIVELDRYVYRRSQRKRLKKIIMAADCCEAQERREA